MLSDSLPPNGLIIVKEHPGIFSVVHNVNKNFRPVTFYNWLARIPKVSLVPIETSSNYLQSVSTFIGTITGNAGFEAVLRGKPVLVFGSASYLTAPNVFKVQSISDIQKVIAQDFTNIDFNKHYHLVMNYLSKISAFYYHSNLNFGSANIMEERLMHTFDALLSSLENN